MKSILIIFHVHFGSSISFDKTTGLLVLYFNLFAIWALSNKFDNAILHTILPIQLSQSWYIFVEPGWMGYLDLWASSMILSWIPSTIGTHNLPWYLNTPSLPCSKYNTFRLWTFAFYSIKIGSWCCFYFTFEIATYQLENVDRTWFDPLKVGGDEDTPPTSWAFMRRFY